MKKPLLRILLAAALGAGAWLSWPKIAAAAGPGPRLGTAAGALARFKSTPKIRRFLQRDDAEIRALLAECAERDAAVETLRGQLAQLNETSPEYDARRNELLHAGLARLETARKVAAAYRRAGGDAAAGADAAQEFAKNAAWQNPRGWAAVAAAAAGLLVPLPLSRRRAAAAPRAGGNTPAAAGAAPRAGEPWDLPLAPGVVLEMLPVPAGAFEKRDGPRTRLVSVAEPFWLGKYEVTQAQWLAVMPGNPSRNQAPENPVECVTHEMAADFCARVTAREREAGRLPEGHEYRLPAEAQWEHACRAGMDAVAGGAVAGAAGGRAQGAGGRTRAVGGRTANAWGFCDMVGNVAEMCDDTVVGNLSGGTRLFSLSSDQKIVRDGFVRSGISRRSADELVGFRLALKRV
ncbi:MAG: formylglycine-generating enzyme family protein [Opitutaceae bacterium]|jgi:hypothetical protein|nr:formylglycine-generating enzyme family protein [Opitutaceae bacterium]